MSACCSTAVAPLRLAPFDCFQRGLATRRLPRLAIVGQRVAGPDGLWAEFSLRVQRGHLAELRFACAACTTLIACCEALAELNRGCAPDSVCVLDAEALWGRLPGMPRAKWDRAVLAVAALRAALPHVQEPVLLRAQKLTGHAPPKAVVPAQAGTQGVRAVPEEDTGSPLSRG